jgi:ABC-type lipopolysaccharide export system ATPase subunit
LISNIQRNLHVRSASQAIEPVDLIKIALDYKKIEKFELITGLIKKEKEIFKEDINRFKIVANTKKFQGAGELKNISGKMIAFSDVYSEYSRPYHFLQKLKEKELLEPTEYYKFFVNIEYKILNQHGFDVSGGERSEFNLIQEISDARDYEMLLIDEPESSFDNLFLKNEVNELVKEISKTIPVVIVTHNNTVGASIKPNYIIYTEKEVTADLPPKKWTL